MKAALIIVLSILSANLTATYYICTISRVHITPTGYYSEYSLVIDDDDELRIEWQYKTLNHSLISKVLNETDVELDLSAYNQGDVIIWDVSLDNEGEGTSSCCEDEHYWELMIYEHIYTSNYQYSLSSKEYEIKKSPEAYAGNMLCGDNDNTNRLVPIEIYDFLPSVREHIPGFKNRPFYNNNTEYIITGNSIMKVITNNTVFEEILTYNGDGILRYHGINYENETVMELYLVKYYVHHYNPTYPIFDTMLIIYRLALGAFVATLISMIILVIALFTGGGSSKKDHMKKNKCNTKNNNYPKEQNYRIKQNNNLNANSGTNVEKKYSMKQLCSNCRTPIDDKATFCHNCGLDIHRQIKFCHYCGHLNIEINNFRCKNHDVKLGCTWLGKGAAAMDLSKFPGARIATKEEALERERLAYENGLVPHIGKYRSDAVHYGVLDYENEFQSICHCCSCCCVVCLMKYGPSFIGKTVNRMEGVEVRVDSDTCVGCGECFKVCIYNGLKMKKNKAMINQDNCRGCGRCENVCPNKAISITIDDFSRIDELIARFEARVDIT